MKNDPRGFTIGLCIAVGAGLGVFASIMELTGIDSQVFFAGSMGFLFVAVSRAFDILEEKKRGKDN